MNTTYDQIMEVEDTLQEARVFLNPYTNQTCHSDSYATIVDFLALNKWIEKKLFTREILLDCISYWLENPNMQPPLRLVALTLQRKL
jgi:hypothetical protein